MSASDERDRAIGNGKYHGADMRANHDDVWQEAEGQLRELVKMKDERIRELEAQLAKSRLDLAVATGRVKSFRAGGAAS